MIARPCASCGEVIASGTRCPGCTPVDTRPRDRVTRQNRARWKNLSRRLRKIQPWCSACGATRDLTVDHRVPVDDRPDLAFELSNLDVLCRSCNSSKGATTWGDNPPEVSAPPRGKAQTQLRMVLKSESGS